MKIDRSGKDGSKSPKNGPKKRFLGFWQKSCPFRCASLLQYESNNGSLTFRKNNIIGKNLFVELWSKTSWLIRMQHSLNYNISQMSWDMKLNFCIWLDIHQSSKYYLVALSGCGQACLGMPKVMTVVSLFYLKNEFSYEVSFVGAVRGQ